MLFHPGFDSEGSPSSMLLSAIGLSILAMYAPRVNWFFALAPCHRRSNKIVSVVNVDVVEPKAC